MDDKDWDDPKNWDFGIRGGCDGYPLDLVGAYSGYNNPPTEQVGLWIRNDGQHRDKAREAADLGGPEGLKTYLTTLMRASHYTQPPARALDATAASGGGLPCVDWVQIAYDLIGDEPDQDDLDRAAEIFEEQYGRAGSDTEVFKLAANQREIFARARATGVL